MTARIFPLPPAVANQIAAGEVIERPASIVKELLENAQDANARKVHIDIGYGGLNQISVSDDGVGIMAEDLMLAIAQHATSKIRDIADLYKISSMGFRGEALASIASVAKITICSKPSSQAHAMKLQPVAGTYQLVPAARANGTTVTVEDLFFQAPVRKKFLKSAAQEFQAIELVVKRFALSALEIGLSLSHNGKEVLHLPSAINDATRQRRIIKIFSSAFLKDAHTLEVSLGSMHLYGLVSGLNYQRSQNDRQWVYINNRMVKDKLIQHAIRQAYDGLLHPGRFGGCLLYLTIDSEEVDVNVHPTKHEVRFQQPRLVHDFLVSQIRSALSIEADGSIVSYPKTSLAHKDSTHKLQTSHVHDLVVNDVSREWIDLIFPHAIIFLSGHAYLIDIMQVYRQEQLAALNAINVVTRSLLVPVRYSLQTKIDASILDNLYSLGMQIHQNSADSLLILTLPACLLQLAIEPFLDAIFKSGSVAREELQALLVTFDLFDEKSLCLEVKMTLQTSLQTKLNQGILPAACCKVLNFANCRDFLDA